MREVICEGRGFLAEPVSPATEEVKGQAPRARQNSPMRFSPCQTGSAYLDQTGVKVGVCCFLQRERRAMPAITYAS